MQTAPPLAPIPDIEDVSELLYHLQFGEKCKSKSSSSSRSSSSDAFINPPALKAHIPASERRAASATKTHFYRGYMSTADELCHLIDPVAGEREDLSPSERAFGLEQIENDPELTTERERRKARERFLSRFEHKILALRRLEVVNDKFHINHASNLFGSPSCEADAVSILKHLQKINALRQKLSDRGEVVGPREIYALGMTLHARRQRREWRYDVLILRPEEVGDPDPSRRDTQQWSILHPVDGPGQHHLRDHRFVSVADGTPLSPIPDVCFDPNSNPPCPDHQRTFNPLLVVINAAHKLEFYNLATPSLPTLPKHSQRLADLNGRIIAELLVQVEVPSTQLILETDTEEDDDSNASPEEDDPPTLPADGVPSRRYRGRARPPPEKVLSPPAPVEDPMMFMNPAISLEYRKQLLLRDLFGDSSFGTSEDL